MVSKCAFSPSIVAKLTITTVVLLSSGGAYPQSFPSQPIKIVVPFGAGGPTDVSARLVSQFLQSKLGQTVVIENRPGAGGAIGSKMVAESKPDGHTLLLATTSSLAVNPAVTKTPGYDAVASFAPVAKISDSNYVLVVRKDFPANTIKDLLAYAKANPNALQYASAGPGSVTHLLMELFKAKTGLNALHITYKSGAEMMTPILGGHVDMAFSDISILLSLIEEGKLKPLAVAGAVRDPLVPTVPTMLESDVPDFVLTFWTGIVAPAHTSDETVNTLNEAINSILHSEDMQQSLAKVGARADAQSAQQFLGFIKSEKDKWRDIAEIAGFK